MNSLSSTLRHSQTPQWCKPRIVKFVPSKWLLATRGWSWHTTIQGLMRLISDAYPPWWSPFVFYGSHWVFIREFIYFPFIGAVCKLSLRLAPARGSSVHLYIQEPRVWNYVFFGLSIIRPQPLVHESCELLFNAHISGTPSWACCVFRPCTQTRENRLRPIKQLRRPKFFLQLETFFHANIFLQFANSNRSPARSSPPCWMFASRFVTE